MVRISLRALIAVLLLAGPVMHVTSHAAIAAQDGTDGMLRNLPGLETAYARKYISDAAIGFATPVTANATTPRVMTVTVLEFDTDAAATTAFDLVLTDRVAGMVMGVQDGQMTSSDIAKLGDRARLFETTTSPEDGRIARDASLLAVQDGNLGFLITAWGTPESLTATLPAVAAFMVETEAGDGAVHVTGNGHLTGGTADLMPGTSDDVLPDGLLPMYDYDLLVSGSPIEAPASSPEASPAS